MLGSFIESHQIISKAICDDLDETKQNILSEAIYDELVQNIDWDLGQDTLRGELAEENVNIMKCVFRGGFNMDNLEKCLGQNYDNVIESYHEVFNKTRRKFEDSILKVLRDNGYDSIASESFEILEKQLDEALENSVNPEIPLKEFENAIYGIVPADMQKIEDLKKKAHGHYLVYLSFKRLIKAYVLMTIACLQKFIDLTKMTIPDQFNYKLYSADKLEEMFPENEIKRMYTKKLNEDDFKKHAETKVKEEQSFNEDLLEQGKFQNAITYKLATGQITPDLVDHSQIPEENFKDIIMHQRNEHNNSLL